jgi:hypothetical protein
MTTMDQPYATGLTRSNTPPTQARDQPRRSACSRGLNRETGCMVIVRADQYVAHVLPLDHHEALTHFFARILICESVSAQ